MDEGIDTTEDTATRRQVQPNVTLDQKGVQSKNLLRLCRGRRATKGSITKKIGTRRSACGFSYHIEKLLLVFE